MRTPASLDHPAWQVARESATLLVSIGGRFGLSPSDRAQLKVGDAVRGPSDDLQTRVRPRREVRAYLGAVSGEAGPGKI